ncbi:uncharacterized protein LOC124925859 isoform X2 [Impatiens glandulifera]|uniref:uncharacterized protein LOC124925859 isoform X2 n=1 Tax=Impatiens glandulifera TaxID=253017 RepID=UPI001FB0A8C7|nr:uncharacterized protein LOC124925859 isoform X2 [Impatiens glandulifera]
MGSCVSISSGSTLKHRRIGSSIQQQQEEEDHNNNNNNVFLGITNPSPPAVTENLKPLQPSPSPNSIHSQNMDYKDEIFFDSQECLDSEDSEDYLSFNGGDLAASSDHENNGFAETVVGIDEEDKSQISTPSTAEYKNKKKLADFFVESLSDDTTDDIKKGDQSLKSGIKHALTISKSERQKLARSLSSCIPNLNRNMSLSDRRRRAGAGGGKLPRQKQLTL